MTWRSPRSTSSCASIRRARKRRRARASRPGPSRARAALRMPRPSTRSSPPTIRIRKRAAAPCGGWAGCLVPRRPCRGGGSVGPAGGRARRTGAPRGRGVLDRARSRAARRRRCGRASVCAGAARWPAELHGILALPRGAGRRPGPRESALTLPTDREGAPRGDPRFARVRLSAPWCSRLRGRGDGRAYAPLPRRAQAALRAVVGYAQESRHHLALHPPPGFPAVRAERLEPAARVLGDVLPLGWRASSPRRQARRSTLCWGRGGPGGVLVHPQARSRVGARGLHAAHAGHCGPVRRRPGCRSIRRSCSTTPPPISTWAQGTLPGSCESSATRGSPPPPTSRARPASREWWAAAAPTISSLGRADPVQRDARVREWVMLSWDEYRRLYGAARCAEPPPRWSRRQP